MVAAGIENELVSDAERPRSGRAVWYKSQVSMALLEGYLLPHDDTIAYLHTEKRSSRVT